MKLAIFSDNFYPELGGIQDSIALLGKELSNKGHQVNFYVPECQAKDFTVAKLPAEEINLGKNVKIIRFFSLPVPSPTKQSRMVIPTGLRWLELKKFNPDIIHTHTFFGLGIEALTAGRFLKKPVIGTNHFSITEYGCYYPKFCQEWFKRNSLKYVIWYYNNCDFVTAPSQTVFTEMLEYGFYKPHQVLSNQIDLAVFNRKYDKQKAKERFKLSDNTIVFAGKLAREKNIDIVIRAVELVKREVKDINFAIAGHGSDREKLKELAKDLHIEKEVKFMGTFNHKTLAKLYRASDIFTIASTSESQSMVLLQAMACGLPVIGVNWRALPEYINRHNGYTVPANNPKAMADKIIHLLRHENERKELGEGGLAYVQQFSAARVADQWIELYNKIIKNFDKKKDRV